MSERTFDQAFEALVEELSARDLPDVILTWSLGQWWAEVSIANGPELGACGVHGVVSALDALRERFQAWSASLHIDEERERPE